MEKEKNVNLDNLEDENIKSINENNLELEEIELNSKENIKNENLNLECLDKIEKLIFLFVNPKSGSEEGLLFFNNAKKYKYKIIKSENELYEIQEGDETYYLLIYDILNQNNYQKGCNLLNEYVSNLKNETSLIRVLVAGGDGTVLSVIEHVNTIGININKCVFGHVPLGTGNDLSNAIGFGCVTEIDKDFNSLKKVLLKYYLSKIGKVDVWELRLSTHKENGEIIQIQQDNKTPKKDKDGHPISSFKRSFINYFSLGYDARVGFGFDKKRSGNRCWNKCIYFWEGLKKNCCRRTIPINNFIESFQVIDLEIKEEIEKKNLELQIENEHKIKSILNNVNILEKEETPQNVNILLNNFKHLDDHPHSDNFDNSDAFDKFYKSKTKTLFRSKTTLTPINAEKDYKDILLKGDPVSLICQNINFYMGGTKDIWKKSGNNFGLEVFENDKISYKETKNLEHLIEQSDQSYNDQKLEFFTYSSGFKLGFEKISTGQADKIYHGPGPMIIKFKDTPTRNKEDKFNRVYLNIDGEYYNIIRPIQIRVRLNKKLSGGSINFLVNN